MPTYDQVVLADSPLGYWKLGESSGPTLADSSGNGHDATITGSLTLGAAGLIPRSTGKSVTFPGTTGNYAEVAGAAWMDQASFSVEAWIASVAAGTSVYLSRYGNTDATDIWDFYIATNVKAQGYNTHTAPYTLDSGAAANDGKAHHVVFTQEAGVGQKLYVDGSLVNTGTDQVWTRSTTQPLRFGQRGAGTLFYAGSMQAVAFYGATLSPARIAVHNSAGRFTDTSVNTRAAMQRASTR